MTRSGLLLALALAGCVHAAPPPPAAAVSPASAVVPAPVSFELLDARVSVLLPGALSTDQRDRLLALRAMVEGMRGKDPVAQRVVYDYVDAVLHIEERSQPEVILGDGVPMAVPIVEESLEMQATPPAAAPETPPLPAPADAAAVSLGPPPPPEALKAAQDALARADYLAAVELLDKIDPADPSAPNLSRARREAVDGYARQEREKAGAAWLEAKAMAEGPERLARLRAVSAALKAVNDRFPDNGYAAQIRDNLQRVDAEIARTSGSESP